MGATEASSPAADLGGIDDAEARAIVGAAIDRYVAARHAKVEGFVDANFGLIGSVRLHRRALGLDLQRAPANVALMVPYLARGRGPRQGGRRGRRAVAGGAQGLLRHRRGPRTRVAAAHRELLELPYDDGRRHSERDALAEEIVADPRLAAALDALAAELRRHRDDPEARARMRRWWRPTPRHAARRRSWSTT